MLLYSTAEVLTTFEPAALMFLMKAYASCKSELCLLQVAALLSGGQSQIFGLWLLHPSLSDEQPV